MKKKNSQKKMLFLISCLLFFGLFMRVEAAVGDGGTVTAISLKGEQSFTFKPASGFTGDTMTINIKEAKLEDGKIVFVMESLPDYNWSIAKINVSEFFNITITDKSGVSVSSEKLFLQVTNPNSIKLYVNIITKLVANDIEFRAETGGSKYDKKYPSITELNRNGDLTLGNGTKVGVNSFRFEPEDVSDDKLQDSRVYAGKVVIEPETDISNIDSERISFSMAAAYKLPENGEYTKASVETTLQWSVGEQAPDLELIATKKDGSEQVFYYTVQLSSDQFLTEINGMLIKKSFEVLDVLNLRDYHYEEDENSYKIIFTKKPGLTSKYDTKGENYTISPQYAIGARGGNGVAADGSFSGNIYEGFDFEIINGKGESRTYHIQAETLWVLQLPMQGHLSSETKVLSEIDGSEEEISISSSGGGVRYGSMMPGAKVTVHVAPEEKDKGKILDPSQVRVLGPTRQPLSGVSFVGNTVIFMMPEGKVTLENLVYKEDDRVSYGIKTAAKLTDGRTTSGLAVSHTVQAGESEIVNKPDAHETEVVTLTTTVPEHTYYHYEFDHWDYGDEALKSAAAETADTDGKTFTTTFSMPAKAVNVTAYYRLEGAEVTLGVSNILAGSMDASLDGKYIKRINAASETDTYKSGGLSLELQAPNLAQYKFKGFSMNGTLLDPAVSGNGITWAEKTVTVKDSSEKYTYQSPTIPLTEGQKVTLKAEFAMIQNGRVTTISSDDSMGTAEALVDGKSLSKDTFINEGTQVTLKAAPKVGYLFTEWKVTSPAQDHGVVFTDSKKAETTFTMPEKGGDLTIQGCFEVDPSYKSNACDMTGAVLLNSKGETVKEASRSGMTFTIQLNAADLTTEEASKLNAGSYFLKLETSQKSSTAMKGGHDDMNSDAKWSEGKVICPLGKNESGEFTVTAEDGTTSKTYTITINYTEPEPEKPVLSAKGVSRMSDQEAEAKFASSLDGNYYFAVVEHGAAAPQVTTSGAAASVKKGVTSTIKLSTLTAGAKDLYVVVKSNEIVSDPLKIEIPAYSPTEKTYKISLSYPPAGGTLTVSSTGAKAGEKITVTVTPKSGKRLQAGSLKYTESVAGGAVVNIDETTKSFTMPASDISISCTWEDEEEPTDPGTPGNSSEARILAFIANGVSGVINDTAGTITVVLPYGTDLTKIPVTVTVPAGVSISPASGQTLDLSSPVDITVTAPDSSKKTYRVSAYTEAQSQSEELWDEMLKDMGASTDSSGPNTWWEKAKRSKRHDSFPSYW